VTPAGNPGMPSMNAELPLPIAPGALTIPAALAAMPVGLLVGVVIPVALVWVVVAGALALAELVGPTVGVAGAATPPKFAAFVPPGLAAIPLVPTTPLNPGTVEGASKFKMVVCARLAGGGTSLEIVPGLVLVPIADAPIADGAWATEV
jgi:hypothetical protein